MTDPAPAPTPRRRWKIYGLLSLWIVCLAVAAWLINESLPMLTGGPMPRPPRRAAPSNPAPAPDPIGQALGGKALAADRLVPVGTTPLIGEPAGLPAPPGMNRLLAYQRTDDMGCEQTAVYEIGEAEPDALSQWYHQRIGQAGYALLSESDQPERLNRLYKQGDRHLTLRIVRRQTSVRVVVQLRYTMAESR